MSIPKSLAKDEKVSLLIIEITESEPLFLAIIDKMILI